MIIDQRLSKTFQKFVDHFFLKDKIPLQVFQELDQDNLKLKL